MSSEDYVEVKLSPGMVTLDGVHWYEQPDGVPMAEFAASLPRPPVREAAYEPCRVYWGSHGCDLERGHVERDGAPHDCGCCECEHHPYPDWPDEGVRCVAKEPYYGPGTNFYGEDATPEAVGRWGQVIGDD